MQVMSSSLPTPKKQVLPRTVTRGESREGDTPQKTVIDYLRATFDKPKFSMNTLIFLLSDYMQTDITGLETGKGLHGFKETIRLDARIDDEKVQIGYIAFGGDSQKGRYMLDLTGKACGLVKDWYSMQNLLEELNATLTRVDIALDFLEGEKTIKHARYYLKRGDFTTSGRTPKSSVNGDWLGKQEGRTLYVGNISYGKQLCVYEKGKELGDLQSPWTRFELRLGNKDRVIPFEVLTSPDQYYSGAYPALEKIIKSGKSQRIETITKEKKISLISLLFHLRRCYGKVFSTVKHLDHIDMSELIESITVKGMPTRLEANAFDVPTPWIHIKDGLHQRLRMQ